MVTCKDEVAKSAHLSLTAGILATALAGVAEQADQGFEVPAQVLEYLPDSAKPIPKQLGVLVTTWRERALSFARESTLLIYSALIDNTLVVVLERLQLDKLLKKAQPWLESGSANLFGGACLQALDCILKYVRSGKINSASTYGGTMSLRVLPAPSNINFEVPQKSSSLASNMSWLCRDRRKCGNVADLDGVQFADKHLTFHLASA